MAKRIKATVSRQVLTWARKTAGYETYLAAAKIGVDEECLMDWESGTDQPSIPQLRKLAELYKRPLAVMYLPEPPLAFQPMHDFRRLPDVGRSEFSPELTLEIRNAHQRRQLALDLLEEEGRSPEPFELVASLNDPLEDVAGRIRSALGVSYGIQSRWRDQRVGFHAWRSKIEEQGVLVFQAARVDSAEASGFAYWADALPFVVVNQKDTYGRRVFSLIHELAHLMLRQSGVSDLETAGRRNRHDEQVEVFCNAVSAATLMPSGLFLAEPLVAAHGPGVREWSDETIRSLATIFSVSREAVARRLLTLSLATESFYGRKRAQYAEEFRAQRLRQKELRGDKGIPRNMPRETIANYGRPFVRMVLSQYYSERLSLAEVSGYLGVKARHVPGIEHTLGMV